MHILLINNHSIHIKKLARLSKNLHNSLTIIDGRSDLKELIKYQQTADLIVLSGGSNGHSVSYDPQYYANQFHLVTHTNKPVIGVCLGAQIIAAAYGGSMKRLDRRNRGQQVITMTKSADPLTRLGSIKVHKSHSWAIHQLGPHLSSLAISKHGHEIIKHRSRPIYGLQFHPEVFPEQTGGAAIFNHLARRHAPQTQSTILTSHSASGILG